MPQVSPTKETVPTLAPRIVTELHAPPSPQTHRALRKLKSAHNLGAARQLGSNPPSLISQQRLRDLQQRNVSPTRRHASSRSPQRNRSNSDAPSPVIAAMNPSLASTNSKRSALSKTSAMADAMSLERLLREGPPAGNVNSALESARLKVLDQGIKSDGDGMVWPMNNIPAYLRDRVLILLYSHPYASTPG